MQTTIQELNAIRQGSARVLIGDSFSSLVDIGALRKLVFTSLSENQEIEFDNTQSLKKFVKGKKVQVAFDLAEINFDNLATLDAGLVNLTTVAGTPVSNTTQVFAANSLAYETFQEIEHQNGDGSALNVDSVTGSVDGALSADVDFHVVSVNGVYGIIVHHTGSGGVTTLNQTFTVQYDYTPNASKKITFNDLGSKTLKVIRLINTDVDGKTLKIDIENGTNFSPIEVTFAADAADDVAILPVEFHGDLVEMVDEQNAN